MEQRGGDVVEVLSSLMSGRNESSPISDSRSTDRDLNWRPSECDLAC